MPMPLSLPEAPTDESLFARFRDQADESSLDELVRRHWTPSYRLALAVVHDPSGAEDLVQEGFIGLVRAARKKQRIDSVAPWLRSSIVNRSRNFLRSRRRRLAHEERAGRGGLVTAAQVDPTAAVREYTDTLPERLRLPLVLHFGLGYTHAEVAQAVECPVGTASSRIRDGLERVREHLVGAGSALSAGTIGATLASATDNAAKAVAPAPPKAAWFVAQAATRGIGLSSLGAKALALVAGALVVGTALALVFSAALEDNGTPKLPGEAARRPAMVGAVASDRGAARVAVTPSGGSENTEDVPSARGPIRGSGTPVPGRKAPAARPSRESIGAVESSRPVLRGRVVDAHGIGIPRAQVMITTRGRAPESHDGANAEPSPEAMTKLMMGALPEAQAALSGDTQGELMEERLRAMLEIMGETRGDSHEGSDTTSHEDGSFSIIWNNLVDEPREPKRESLVIRARAERDGVVDVGTRLVAWHDVQIRQDEFDAGDIVLERLPSVTVFVRASGAALAGAKVDFGDGLRDFFDQMKGRSSTSPTLSDATGMARHGTSAHVLVVTVTKEGFAEERRLVRVEGDTSVEFDLVPEARLAGHVVDPEGRPVVGATVAAVVSDGLPRTTNMGALETPESLRSSGTLTSRSDAQGRFSLLNVGAGRTYELIVHSAGGSFLDGSLPVTVPNADVTVTLERGNALVVEVKSRGRELPPLKEIASDMIQNLGLEREEPSEGWTPFDATAAFTDGQVRFPRIAPGRYRVRWSGGIAGFAPAVSEAVTVEPLKAPSVLLELAPGRELTGRVIDPMGQPVAGAVVTLGDDYQGNEVKTGQDGSFKIADAPLGDVTVHVAAFAGAEVLFGEATAPVGHGSLPDIVVSPMPDEGE